MIRIVYLTVIIFYFPTIIFAQKTYYVTPAGAGNQDGSSWQHAYRGLHHALWAAQSGDEIWVAQGYYYPDNGSDRGKTFIVKSGVKLLGSFRGNETQVNERNIELFPTILSGNVGSIQDSTDNSNNIMLLRYPKKGTIIDGFTFEHGYAKTDTLAAVYSLGRAGAAIFIQVEDSVCFPLIRNCKFLNNYATGSGGAVFFRANEKGGGVPLFDNCQFINNRCGFEGGAISWTGGTEIDPGIEFNRCFFDKNNATGFGGSVAINAIYGESIINFIDCNIYHSDAKPIYGKVLFHIVESEKVNRVEIDMYRCRVHSYYNDENPAMQFHDFLMENLNINGNIPTLVDIKIANSIFRRKNGYLLFIDYGRLNHKALVQNSFFEFSSYFGQQNSIYKNNIYLNINFISAVSINATFNTIFLCNDFVYNNKGIYHLRLLNNSNQPHLIFYQNKIMNMGDSILFVMGTQNSNRHYSLFINNLLYRLVLPYKTLSNIPINNIINFQNNVFYENRDVSGQKTILYSNAKDSCILNNNLTDIDISQLPPGHFNGQGNLFNTNPEFQDTAAGDFRLQPCSPAINAGDTVGISHLLSPFDFAGNPRISDGKIDIGPFEMPPISLQKDSIRVVGSCAGGTSGAIDFLPLNACPPFSIQWQNGALAGQNTQQLAPGDYQITLTDSRGRTLQDTLTVPTVLPPVLATTSQSIVCGETVGGIAQADMPNGTPPLQFLWATGDTTHQVEGLPAGIVAVTVTDAAGCSNAALIDIKKTGGLQIDIAAQPIRCHNGSDGSLQILPLDGKAPYQFLWSNGAQTDSIAGLAAGIFEGTLTDALGCDIAWSLPLQNPSAIAATATVSNATGVGNSDGSIRVDSILGGTAPYLLNWSNGAKTLEINNLSAGNYTLTITDANGCEQVFAWKIEVVIGTDEPQNGATARVFPNPFSNFLMVKNAGIPAVFQLFDAAGKLLFQQKVPAGGSLQLGTQHLPAGDYFWKLGTHGGRLVRG